MKNEMVIRINSVGIASRQRRKINFNIARTFWRVPLHCSQIRHDGASRDPLHVLPLMFDNVEVFGIDVIHRVFTGIATDPRFHQAGVNVVIDRYDRAVFVQLLLCFRIGRRALRFIGCFTDSAIILSNAGLL